MKPVTKRWCTSCEGHGKLIDVRRSDESIYDDHPFAGNYAELGVEKSRIKGEPYDCRNCAGAGFYFYDNSKENWGRTILARDLPHDAEVQRVSGPLEWVEAQAAR